MSQTRPHKQEASHRHPKHPIRRLSAALSITPFFKLGWRLLIDSPQH